MVVSVFLGSIDLLTGATFYAFESHRVYLHLVGRQQQCITPQRVEGTNSRRGKGLRGREIKLRVGKVKKLKVFGRNSSSTQLHAGLG